MAEQADNSVITDPGPGVHVVVHPEPRQAGRRVADAIDGMLVDLPMMAESAVAQRLRLPEARANWRRLAELEEAARGLVGGNFEADRELFERRAELQHIAHRRLLDQPTADRLQALARELTSLERSLERTEQARPADDDAEAQPGPSPAMRAAAAAVRAEEAAVADAHVSLALLPLAGSGTATAATDPEPAPETDDPDPLPGRQESHHTEADHTEADHTEADHTEADHTEADHTEADHTEADHTEADHTEADHTEADHTEADRPGAPHDGDGTEEVELWHPERLAGRANSYDGSVLMPLGIFSIGFAVACGVLLTGLPRPAAGVALILAVVAAAISRYSIKVESRAHTADAPAETVVDGPAIDGSDAGPEVDPTSAPAPAISSSPAGDDRPDPDELAGATDELSRRTHAVEQAETRLAVARAAWSSLTTADADPHAAELLGRSADADDAAEGGTSPAVRALAAVHRGVRAEWRVTWAELGRVAPPPDDAVVELMLADLRETAPDPAEAAAMLDAVADAERRLDQRTILAAALDGDELATLRAQAPDDDDLDDRPLVLVMPFTDLSPKRAASLRQRLDGLSPELTVVIIVRSSSDVPTVPATT